jgi:hypothetical protein
MEKATKKAKAWIIILICAVAAVLVAVPIVRARFYWGDEPVFMGNPGMQQLIYHGSDIVMLPEKRENIFSNLAYATYNGNTYVGEYGIDWIFDEDKMQYAGQMHRRMILHLYNNYDVYVSANAVTEDGTPIFLTRKGEPSPFYYVLEGYEAPDLMTTDLKFVVETKGNEWNLPNTVKLADIVDLQNEISYNDAMKKICTARLVSAQYDFMCTFAPVYKLGEQYYLHIAMNTYCPITSEDLIEYLSHIEKQQTV